MFKVGLVGFVLLCAWNLRVDCQSYVQPQQIHLSYGGDPSLMYVTWLTFSTTLSSVEYGVGKMDQTTAGNVTEFVDGGSLKRKLYIHRVLLQNLKPKQTYVYHVGSSLGWSNIFYFTTLPEGTTGWQPRFAVYGDMGNVNGQSLGRLQQETQAGHFDMILHVGDFAYDMDTNNAEYGDAFLRQIEPIAGYVPYMTVVGNHENAYNFSNYVNRFTMPGGDSNFFYSFDVGPAHIIGFSTEFYFYVQYGWQQIVNQYVWLEQDLKKAAANRDKVPWIITMGHRPMYCSNADHDDCTKYESVIRGGLPYVHAYGLEDLFYKYGVDLQFYAHEHSYERIWPIFNRTVYNGTVKPYTDPCAPVQIVSGSAGCQEHHDPFIPDPGPWSAFQSTDYGYGRMTVFNETHLHFEQVSDDQGGVVIDSFYLIKHTHGPYDPSKCREAGHRVAMDYVAPAWKKVKKAVRTGQL